MPTPAALPIGIFAGADGGVWFTETAAGKIGRIDIATKAIEEYPTPAALSAPFVLRAETEGRYIWFGELAANRIGRIDTVTRIIAEYPIPTPNSTPLATCNTESGDVYFTHLMSSSIGKIDGGTGEITEIPLPTDPAHVNGGSVELSCGPADSIWFVQILANRVGRISLGD
ncbi:hypothetical protein FXW78_22845 [Rhodococcus opacus]|nr:hypothetical protein [Rhodococcus opacus]